MPDRTKRAGTVPSAGDGLRVLTVFSHAAHRALVARACTLLAPQGTVIDAATATDAVLQLLSQPVDVLLIDVAWAGEFLGALERHARRSAPGALVLAFATPSVAGAAGTPQALGTVHAWSDMESILHARLPEQAAHRTFAPTGRQHRPA